MLLQRDGNHFLIAVTKKNIFGAYNICGNDVCV